MPIINLQKKLREAGRIRIGQQVPTSNGRTRPEKLTTFRLTSPGRAALDQAAELWGGTVGEWQSPNGPQPELITATAELPVVVPVGEMGFSQWFESWTAGGCKKRCDGEWDVLRDKACDCDPEHRECAMHTRLSVLLPDLGGIGLWRLDTSGYYAAVELAGADELCRRLGSALVPGRLRLEQRSVKREHGKGKVQTLRFAVPTLDLDVRLNELTGGPAPALTAGTFTPVPVADLPEAPGSSVAEQLANVGQPEPRRANSAEPLRSTGLQPRTAAEASGGVPAEHPGAPLPASDTPVPPPDAIDPATLEEVKALLAELSAEEAVEVKAWWRAQQFPPVNSGHLTQTQAQAVIDYIVGRPFDPPPDPHGSETPSDTNEQVSESEPTLDLAGDDELRTTARKRVMAEANKAWPGKGVAAARQREERRHALARILFGAESTSDLTTGQLGVLGNWLRDVTDGRVRLADDLSGLLQPDGSPWGSEGVA